MRTRLTDIDIRIAIPEDMGSLIEPLLQYLRLSNKSPSPASLELLLAYILNSSNSGIVIVVSEEKTVGFAIFSFTFSFESPDSFMILCLEDVWVNEHYRGHHIGRKLFNKAEEIAKNRGCSAMIGLVDRTNKPLLAFWSRLGAQMRTEVLMKKSFLKCDIQD